MIPLVLLLLIAHSSAAVERLTTDPDLSRNVPTSELLKEYDYVIVGAGPAGATLANRLTEVSSWNVLLLEAGGDELKITNVPFVTSVLPITRYNWGYRNEPEANACLGLKDRRCGCPRGKGMGGSSLMSYMIYSRGHPGDYDGWEALGNSGWAWRHVLKFFMKSENATGDFANSQFHSRGGYLDVQRVPYQTKISQEFLNAAKEMGYPIIDYNSDSVIGFSRLQVTMRNGSRYSASRAFLRPIRDRSNLHVVKFAHVTKVLIDPNSKSAYGVQFKRGGQLWSVNASREVILSAGAINTPQLLMLSGVGPKEHLESRKIPVILDLPGVGQNLQDHVLTAAQTYVMANNDGFNLPRELLTLQNYVNHSQTGETFFSIPGGAEALGFIRTSISQTSPSYPDIELLFTPIHFGSDHGLLLRRALGISDSVYNKVWRSIAYKPGFMIVPILLQPQSRGKIELRNKNPLSFPKIFANYLNEEHDINSLVEGIKYVRKFLNTRVFQKYNVKEHTTPIPGCEQHEFGTDEYLKCAVQQITDSAYNPCCTAKMGPSSDPMAVVDSELRVYGLEGLRVVDASIMPRIVGGHIMAATYMIAENAADIIKSSSIDIRILQ